MNFLLNINSKKNGGVKAPTIYTSMALDIIYLIIATPVAFAIGYAHHCIKRNSKRLREMPEATPYQFEKDEPIANFDEFSKAIYDFKFYKGKAR